MRLFAATESLLIDLDRYFKQNFKMDGLTHNAVPSESETCSSKESEISSFLTAHCDGQYWHLLSPTLAPHFEILFVRPSILPSLVPAPRPPQDDVSGGMPSRFKWCVIVVVRLRSDCPNTTSRSRRSFTTSIATVWVAWGGSASIASLI